MPGLVTKTGTSLRGRTRQFLALQITFRLNVYSPPPLASIWTFFFFFFLLLFFSPLRFFLSFLWLRRAHAGAPDSRPRASKAAGRRVIHRTVSVDRPRSPRLSADHRFGTWIFRRGTSGNRPIAGVSDRSDGIIGPPLSGLISERRECTTFFSNIGTLAFLTKSFDIEIKK